MPNHNVRQSPAAQAILSPVAHLCDIDVLSVSWLNKTKNVDLNYLRDDREHPIVIINTCTTTVV